MFLFQIHMPLFTTNFEELPVESKLQPGDILLFPLQNRPIYLPDYFKHAVVYCGDEEIIHFQSELMLPIFYSGHSSGQ